VAVDHAVVQRVRAIYGERLRGLFAFGSRVAGVPRPDSDLDLGVWLDGPLRRRDTWLPWIAAFERADPPLDPTFITTTSLDAPPPWLLEAVRAGVEVWFDPSGDLAHRLRRVRAALAGGEYRRRLFMGLPYYERTAS
jgi:predicted nucleotidyltransferase